MQLHSRNQTKLPNSYGDLCSFGRIKVQYRKLNNHRVNDILKAILEIKYKISLMIPDQEFQIVFFPNLILKIHKTNVFSCTKVVKKLQVLY